MYEKGFSSPMESAGTETFTQIEMYSVKGRNPESLRDSRKDQDLQGDYVYKF